MNPAELSRPAIGLTTPVLTHKSITVSAPVLQKTPKIGTAVPARIDLEPVYSALKSALGPEQWLVYKETIPQFLVGMSDPIHPPISLLHCAIAIAPTPSLAMRCITSPACSAPFVMLTSPKQQAASPRPNSPSASTLSSRHPPANENISITS